MIAVGVRETVVSLGQALRLIEEKDSKVRLMQQVIRVQPGFHKMAIPRILLVSVLLRDFLIVIEAAVNSPPV